jgi:replication initiation and membrane attachment protein
MKLAKTYVEKIAGHWARKKVGTVGEAMALAKEENRQYQEWAETKKKGRTAKRTVRKEMVPDWLKEEPKEQAEETVKNDISVEKKASTLDDERKRLEEVLKKYKRD